MFVMLLETYSLNFLFYGIASVKCIMVPLISNAVFLMYVNLITFGFKGSMFVVSFI